MGIVGKGIMGEGVSEVAVKWSRLGVKRTGFLIRYKSEEVLPVTAKRRRLKYTGNDSERFVGHLTSVIG